MSYLDKEKVSDEIDRSRLLAITSSAWILKGHLPFASTKEGALSVHKQQHHVVLRQAQHSWRAVGTNLGRRSKMQHREIKTCYAPAYAGDRSIRFTSWTPSGPASGGSFEKSEKFACRSLEGTTLTRHSFW